MIKEKKEANRVCERASYLGDWSLIPLETLRKYTKCTLQNYPSLGGRELGFSYSGYSESLTEDHYQQMLLLRHPALPCSALPMGSRAHEMRAQGCRPRGTDSGSGVFPYTGGLRDMSEALEAPSTSDKASIQCPACSNR